MSGDILYFCLMGLGWFFLVGWALALVAAVLRLKVWDQHAGQA